MHVEVITAHSSLGGGFFTNREGPFMSSLVGGGSFIPSVGAIFLGLN